MAGEFGGTPSSPLTVRVVNRDVITGVGSRCFLCRRRNKGGNVVGASDRRGGYPAADPYTPEDVAATIYSALGLPETVAWYDKFNRPHQVYHGTPIRELL